MLAKYFCVILGGKGRKWYGKNKDEEQEPSVLFYCIKTHIKCTFNLKIRWNNGKTLIFPWQLQATLRSLFSIDLQWPWLCVCFFGTECSAVLHVFGGFLLCVLFFGKHIQRNEANKVFHTRLVCFETAKIKGVQIEVRVKMHVFKG